MENKLPLTIAPDDVKSYRNLYYEHYKPLIAAFPSITIEQLENIMEPVLEDSGWTWDEFQLFKDIDLFQRLSKFQKNNVNITVEISGTIFTKDEMFNFQNLPELRCPIRSQDIC